MHYEGTWFPGYPSQCTCDLELTFQMGVFVQILFCYVSALLFAQRTQREAGDNLYLMAFSCSVSRVVAEYFFAYTAFQIDFV